MVPDHYIGLAIGGALLLGGLTAGAIVAAVESDKGKGLRAAGEELWKQVKSIPETMLTGFIIGMIFGAIQRSIVKHKPTIKVTDEASAKEYVRQHGIAPADATIRYNPGTGYYAPNGAIEIKWTIPNGWNNADLHRNLLDF